MSSEPGEEGSIFTALGHEIRRNIIRILAEKGSRTFTELMDDLDIRDTGTMVFHLKRLGPLVSKNEKGEYILTSTGWKAYEILKEISGKRGPQSGDSGQDYGYSVEEAKKAGEPMAKASQQAQPWDVVGDVIILSDRIKLYVDRKLLENIRAVSFFMVGGMLLYLFVVWA